MAAWQWFNLHRDNANEGEIVINLDETSNNLGMQLLPGYRYPLSQLRPRGPIARVMTLAERRTALTAVLMVCDAFWLQAFLPQILIANDRTVKAKDLEGLRQGLPSNVHLWREKSAWVKSDIFERALDLLGRVVQAKCPRARAILLMDTCPVHTQARVLRACLRKRLRLVFTPALCTSLLQPLDSHVFAVFKNKLR